MIHVPEAGLWFPDGETHFTGKDKRGRPVWRDYQADRLKAALGHVRHWLVAVDVGAHVGLIARQLAGRFTHVLAFEPGADTADCLARNTADFPNVRLFRTALGAAAGEVGIEPAGANSGDRQLVPGGAGVPVATLDSADLTACGLLKLDVQGYEYDVLRGAEATVRKFRPVVLLEDEPAGKLRRQFAAPGAAGKLLESWGARLVASVGADRVYAFPETA